MADYNHTSLPAGPDRLPLLMATLLKKRIRMQGFIIMQDYSDRFDEFFRYREQIVDGLEKAPDAFIGLLEGKNFGKLVIRVADDA